MQYFQSATTTTPEVSMDLTRGRIQLVGRSNPVNGARFYSPVINALRNKAVQPKKMSVDVCLEYFDSSSSRCLYDMFVQLKKMKEWGSRVKVNWFYDPSDDDMLETAADYSEIVDLEFNFINNLQLAN